MNKAGKLKSFRSSRDTTRTFCGACGSPIAWDRKGYENIYILMGALDGDIRVKGAQNIHVKDRGHYYEIHD